MSLFVRMEDRRATELEIDQGRRGCLDNIDCELYIDQQEKSCTF